MMMTSECPSVNALVLTHPIQFGSRLSVAQVEGALGFGHYLATHQQHSSLHYTHLAGFGMHSSPHLTQAVEIFNSLVSPADVVSVESLLTTPVSQKSLSGKLDDHVFNLLLNSSSVADKARLLSVFSPHAASWLSVVPSES